MLRARMLVAGAVVLLVAPACLSRGEATQGAAKVAEVTGVAEVKDAGGAWSALGSGGTVPEGALVRVRGAGALLMTGGGSRLELGADTEAVVESASALRLQSGSVLAEAGGDAPVAVEVSGFVATVKPGAIARVDRLFSIRIGTYRGEVTVSAANGGALDVSPYRQIGIAGTALPREPRPLSISDGDSWDVRFLAPMLDLDRELRTLGRGFDAKHGQPRSAEFFRDFLPVEDLGIIEPYIGKARGSDVLIGLVVAALYAQAGEVSQQDAFASVMDLRSRGAVWGLVAAEHGLDASDLISLMGRAVAGELRAGGVPQASPGARPSGPGGGRDGGRGNGGGSGGGGSGGGGSGGGSTSSPKPSPTSSPSPSPTASPSPSPTPSPSPSPSECSVVDQLLDPDRCPS